MTVPEGCALLFGGSGGIGRGIARLFARGGSDVAIVCRSNTARAALTEEARAAGRLVTAT